VLPATRHFLHLTLFFFYRGTKTRMGEGEIGFWSILKLSRYQHGRFYGLLIRQTAFGNQSMIKAREGPGRFAGIFTFGFGEISQFGQRESLCVQAEGKGRQGKGRGRSRQELLV